MSEFHPTAEQERECLRRLGTRPAGVSDAYKPSLKHLLADAMLGGSQRHMMEVGGSRSGKTFGLVKATCTRAISAPESRHAIFRLRFNAVKQSIGMDTLPKVMRLRYPHIKYGYNKSDQFFRFYNKTRPKADASELWLAGLDDKERVERVLGKEYCLSPDARVLTADLRWVRAIDLGVGDEIVGFPEDLDGHMRLVRAAVTSAHTIQAHRYRIVTSRGETVVSAGHRFVGYRDDRRTQNFRSLSWVKAECLEVGDKIRFACSP